MKEEKNQSVHYRMAKIKQELAETEIKKSGLNKFAGFKYHELSDFIHVINKLNVKYGINDHINIDEANGVCSITLTNIDNSEDFYIVSTPFREAEMLGKGGAASSVDVIQRMGSTITYNRRYLYMTAYSVQEGDGIDGKEPIKKPEAIQQPVQVQLPIMNATQFSKAVDRIIAGEKGLITELRKAFVFTDAQEAELSEIL